MGRHNSTDDPLALVGLELTTIGAGIGRIIGRSTTPDYEVLAAECPGNCPDTGVAETVGRLLNWPERRIDDAIAAGLRAGVFQPE